MNDRDLAKCFLKKKKKKNVNRYVELRWGDPGASEPDVTFYFFMSYTLGIETNPFTGSFVRPFKSEKCKKKNRFFESDKV